jgi:hypothetical protein
MAPSYPVESQVWVCWIKLSLSLGYGEQEAPMEMLPHPRRLLLLGAVLCTACAEEPSSKAGLALAEALEGDVLTIESVDGTWATQPMVAVDGDRLRHEAEYSSSGCTVYVEIELGVDALKPASGEGRYQATISSDGGLPCVAYAASLGLPEACTVSGPWSIER